MATSIFRGNLIGAVCFISLGASPSLSGDDQRRARRRLPQLQCTLRRPLSDTRGFTVTATSFRFDRPARVGADAVQSKKRPKGSAVRGDDRRVEERMALKWVKERFGHPGCHVEWIVSSALPMRTDGAVIAGAVNVYIQEKYRGLPVPLSTVVMVLNGRIEMASVSLLSYTERCGTTRQLISGRSATELGKRFVAKELPRMAKQLSGQLKVRELQYSVSPVQKGMFPYLIFTPVWCLGPDQRIAVDAQNGIAFIND